jgi:hypothetical protein
MRHRPALLTAAILLFTGGLRSVRGDEPTSGKLGEVRPPGGVPLNYGRPGTPVNGDALRKASARLGSAPPDELDKWVAELERIAGGKLDGDLARQACRTYFVSRLSAAFDDLKWDAKAADGLFRRARTLPAAEAKAWEEAFEALLGKKIGQTDKENLAGGPAYAVPLVLIPVDALYDGQTYSVERGMKYRDRLKQLAAADVALWRDKVDRFAGTNLDAAVNLVLRDDYFEGGQFRREKYEAAVGKSAR